MAAPAAIRCTSAARPTLRRRCTCAGVEFGSQLFWPFAVASEPRPCRCGSGKGVTREYPRAELGSACLDVSAVGGSGTDPTAMLALASLAAGTSPNAMRDLYKRSKCQNMSFSPGVYSNALNASLLALFLAQRMLSLSPASLMFTASLVSRPWSLTRQQHCACAGAAAAVPLCLHSHQKLSSLTRADVRRKYREKQ